MLRAPSLSHGVGRTPTLRVRHLAVLGVWVAACGGPAQIVTRDVAELNSPNGVSLNGVSLNGVSLNGVSLNGVSLNGVSLNGVSLNGVSLNGVSAGSGAITGVSGGANTTGAALVGAKLNGQLSNGTTLPLRIDAVRVGTAPDTDVQFYKVAFQGAGGWSPLCGTDSGGNAIEALVLAGRWNDQQGVVGGGARIEDDTAITFACLGRALAKCVLFGYKPWKSVTGVNLRNHHQACTRMLRADYCGDGTPHTVDGTPINLYDSLGIETDAASWNKESEWSASGATCVSQTSALRLQRTGTSVPACVSARVLTGCGAFRSGTLLVTEYNAPLVAKGWMTIDPIVEPLPIY